MTHTPGPWHFLPGLTNHNIWKDGLILARVFKFEKDPETADYNAHLIAAAPELLDALQLLFEDWKTLVGEDLKENNSDVLNLWNKTIAAITKATGEQR